MTDAPSIATREAATSHAKTANALAAIERAFLACRFERERIEATQRMLVEHKIRDKPDRGQLLHARAFEVAERTLAFVFQHYDEFRQIRQRSARDAQAQKHGGDTERGDGERPAE